MLVPHIDIAVKTARSHEVKLRNVSYSFDEVSVSFPSVYLDHVIFTELGLILFINSSHERLFLLGNLLKSLNLLICKVWIVTFLWCDVIEFLYQGSNIPFDHVTHLISSIQNHVLTVVIHSSNREMRNLTNIRFTMIHHTTKQRIFLRVVLCSYAPEMEISFKVS